MINVIKNKILNGYEISKDEALNLAQNSDLNELLSTADEIRARFCGDKFNICSIMNVKSGKCSEDCAYCAQSRHFNTNCDEYDMKNSYEILEFAKSYDENKVHRFSLVASGRGLKGSSKDMDSVTKTYELLDKKTNLHLCASFGIADENALIKLKSSGVKTYHHNLETSRNYYPKICSTHSYDDRINTIKLAKKVGLDVCSGGIFGLGESLEDRIDMAFDLKNLNITSVPINILNPIKNTPLYGIKPLDEDEILRSIAIFRFILPKAYLRFAGGRNNLKDSITKALKGGINAAISGNFLTIKGDDIINDKVLFKSCGFDISRDENV